MKKISLEVTSVEWVKDYILRVHFADGHESVVDFEPALEKYARGYYSKYRRPDMFKKFKIDQGNLVWGKDWDLMFPPESIYYNKN